ncbi:MAG: hypothetical protein KBD97_02525 [Bacteroidaceae bacterium]|nr:hypothetical protein [Bacteroidaceae bacterium]
MKKCMLLSVLLTAFVLPVVGQSYDDDDMYYVPSKKAEKTVTITVTTSGKNQNEEADQIRSSSYAPVNNRVDEMDVDAYNRRGTSSAVSDSEVASQGYDTIAENETYQNSDEEVASDENGYVYTTRISRYNNPTVVLYLGDSYWDDYYYGWSPYYSYYNSWGIGWRWGGFYSSFYSPYWGGYYGGYYPYYGGYYPYYGHGGHYAYRNSRGGGFRPYSRPTDVRGTRGYGSRSNSVVGSRSSNFRSNGTRSGNLNSSGTRNNSNEYTTRGGARSYSAGISNSRNSQQRVNTNTVAVPRGTNTNTTTTNTPRVYVPSTNTNSSNSRSYTPSTSTNSNYSSSRSGSYSSGGGSSSGGSSRSTGGGGGSRGGGRR